MQGLFQKDLALCAYIIKAVIGWLQNVFADNSIVMTGGNRYDK